MRTKLDRKKRISYIADVILLGKEIKYNNGIK